MCVCVQVMARCVEEVRECWQEQSSCRPSAMTVKNSLDKLLQLPTLQLTHTTKSPTS